MFSYKAQHLPHTGRHICLQKKKTEPISCLLLGGPSLRIFNQPSVRKENDLPLCPRLSSWLARLLAIIIIIQSQCLTSEKLKFTNGRLKM